LIYIFLSIKRKFLHESRHKHAMNRARGVGGRFAKKTNDQSASQDSQQNQKYQEQEQIHNGHHMMQHEQHLF
jgi:hypothetical protein